MQEIKKGVKPVELIFKADSASKKDLVPILLENIPEFEFNESTDVERNVDGNYDVSIHVKGSIFTDEHGAIETFIKKLTHHAEALYEDTDYEFVHVEVCVDGIWFGR